MGWGWYLQNDMQLFVASLLLLLVYSIKPIISKILIILLIIGSAIFTYTWTFNHGVYVISHLQDFSTFGDYMTNVYMKPWARASPYLWGLFVGIFYSEYLSHLKGAKPTHQTEFKKILNQTVLGKIEMKVKENRKVRILIEWTGIIIIIFLPTIPRTLQQGI